MKTRLSAAVFCAAFMVLAGMGRADGQDDFLLSPPREPPDIVTTPATAPAGEVIPPTPKQYVTDDGGFLTAAAAAKLEGELKQLERTTSDQLIVAIYPHMQSTDNINAYATRVFNEWKVGQAGKNNGVVVLIFFADRTLRITVGKGLEKTLTDKVCQDIVDKQFVANLKVGNADKAVTDGVQAIVDLLEPAATSTAPAPAPAEH